MLKQIELDIKEAMRNKDKVALSTLRLLKSTMENERISLKRELTDDDCITCVNRNLKQLQQEIDSLLEANRSVNSQLEQRAVLIDYLPKQLTQVEVEKKVHKAVLKVKHEGGNFGKVMSELSSMKGKADMKFVSKLAREVFDNVEVG